eukprot:GHVS01066961.1.p2 GENE.GHVS01066961.1~~GHVS01066961.1.p2  ORF type:complete len:223 (+),score=37.43 GHVS01066961.1:742-1410(+)
MRFLSLLRLFSLPASNGDIFRFSSHLSTVWFLPLISSQGSASRKKTSAGGPRHTPRTWGAMIDNLLEEEVMPAAVPKQPGDGEGQFRSVIQSNGPRRPSKRRVTPMMQQLSAAMIRSALPRLQFVDSSGVLQCELLPEAAMIRSALPRLQFVDSSGVLQCEILSKTSAMQAAVPKQPGDGEGQFSSVIQSKSTNKEEAERELKEEEVEVSPVHPSSGPQGSP